MSGTGQQARDGDLVAYLSGDDAAKARARPVLEAFTRAQYDLGAFGQGTAMKLVANLLVAVHNAAAAEALHECARLHRRGVRTIIIKDASRQTITMKELFDLAGVLSEDPRYAHLLS